MGRELRLKQQRKRAHEITRGYVQGLPESAGTYVSCGRAFLHREAPEIVAEMEEKISEYIYSRDSTLPHVSTPSIAYSTYIDFLRLSLTFFAVSASIDILCYSFYEIILASASILVCFSEVMLRRKNSVPDGHIEYGFPFASAKLTFDILPGLSWKFRR